MVVRKLRPLTIECVVRGYLAGSGWTSYDKSGSVCGIRLPPGLRQAGRLPEPIFTPTTKAPKGSHDEAIDDAQGRGAGGRRPLSSGSRQRAWPSTASGTSGPWRPG